MWLRHFSCVLRKLPSIGHAETDQPRHCNRHVFAGRLVMAVVYGNLAKARPKQNK